MNNEIEETAKAVQEVAKTTGKAIEATEKLSGFVARVTNESIEAVTGMLSDKLRFMRWERQLRLANRAKEIIRERGLENNFRVVPPKIALPIIENASLEENDELQDLWANLLASALDLNFDGTLRTAFIDILKQLEIIDVHILEFIYSFEGYKSAKESGSTQGLSETLLPHSYPKKSIQIQYRFELSDGIYRSCIDNLIRVRCVAPYVEYKTIARADYGIRAQMKNENYYEEVTFDYQYEQVCLTSLGVRFIEACTNQKKTIS